MGYVIKVGNAIPHIDKNDILGWEITNSIDQDCPTFVGDNNQTNMRAPSYLVWSAFCKTVDLEEMFYLPAYRDIPKRAKGVIYLTNDSLGLVSNALTEYQTKAKLPPGFEDDEYLMANENSLPRYDGHLARLIWLAWWIEWALSNCTMPALSIH
jgi:hypothetical protein